MNKIKELYLKFYNMKCTSLKDTFTGKGNIKDYFYLIVFALMFNPWTYMYVWPVVFIVNYITTSIEADKERNTQIQKLRRMSEIQKDCPHCNKILNEETNNNKS